MIGNAARSPREMDAEIEKRAHRITAYGNLGRPHRRTISVLRAFQSELLRVEHDAIAIHRPAVDVAEVADPSSIGCGRRRLREPDCFERFLCAEPKQHLLRPAGRGDETDADLYQ